MPRVTSVGSHSFAGGGAAAAVALEDDMLVAVPTNNKRERIGDEEDRRRSDSSGDKAGEASAWLKSQSFDLPSGARRLSCNTNRRKTHKKRAGRGVRGEMLLAAAAATKAHHLAFSVAVRSREIFSWNIFVILYLGGFAFYCIYRYFCTGYSSMHSTVLKYCS